MPTKSNKIQHIKKRALYPSFEWNVVFPEWDVVFPEWDVVFFDWNP